MEPKFCKIEADREQYREVFMCIIMIEQAQCLALKSSQEVFVESNRVQEWRGNSTAEKQPLAFQTPGAARVV